jgi:4-diphosphocytidyl-2-C-methyl-D-erythritol kinase
LESIAASLGSDIPFFIRSSPSLCRGRGEIVEPLGILPKANILLVKPPFPVPTAWAYQAYKNKPKTSETFSQWHGSIELMNDLEEPVFSKYLVLPVLKRWLLDQSGVRCAMMSGSGSTIFAILNEDVLDLEDRVLAYFGPSFLVRRCQLLGTHHTDHC